MERYNESDTRANLITPALRARGWTAQMIRREQTAGEILADDKGAYRSDERRVMDYILRVIPREGAQPVAVAIVEAKSNDKSPGAGIEQAKRYMRLVHIPFAYSTNGERFVEYDATTGKTTQPESMAHFPSPEALRRRYEEYHGFTLNEECAKPLTTATPEAEAARRYYQDAAIRAALQKIAADEKAGNPGRALLSLATGAGKTHIAVQLLKQINDANKMRRALFLCDRDALRNQALSAFSHIFRSDAAAVRRGRDGENEAQNARIHIATYQTLGISGDDDNESESNPNTDTNNQTFIEEHYPQDHFSHIIIDECHRSAWGKWSQILTRNPNATQIGLTATPRRSDNDDNQPQTNEDQQITADNYAHFGAPAYSYTLPQGAEDGYLALCHIRKANIDLDNTGITIEELMQHNPIDYNTGAPLTEEALKKIYEERHFEAKLVLPDRIAIMCAHLFDNILTYNKADPHQKTIIFCASDIHAELVAREMNNQYAQWQEGKQSQKRKADPYAFQCTSKTEGNKTLPDFKGGDSHHFIATTVDLLTTGVDIPRLRNIAFFKYVKSPILLHQMIGRGARIDEANNKLDFAVYDYTDATRLLGKEEWQKPKHPQAKRRQASTEQTPIPTAAGFKVQVADTGEYVVVQDESGNPIRVSAEEYRKRLINKLMERIKNPAQLRAQWTDNQKRDALLKFLSQNQSAPEVLGRLLSRGEYDGYDILAEAAFGTTPRTRRERAAMFNYRNGEWIRGFNDAPQKTILALVRLFAGGGIAELESGESFNANSVRDAGGIDALQSVQGTTPKALIDEIKKRLFAA